MKFLSWTAITFTAFFIALYITLFTTYGNSLLKPFIQTQLNSATNLNIELKTFTLSCSEFIFVLDMGDNNKIEVDSKYSLFSQTIDLNYNLSLNKLSSIGKQINQNLNGSLFTSGTIIGDINNLTIDGTSDVAKSQTLYTIHIVDLEAKSINANIKDANLSTILNIIGQKNYADALINLKLNLINIKPSFLDGKVSLLLNNAKLNTEILNKEFGLNITEANFATDLNVDLKNDKIDYTYNLNSNILNINSTGLLLLKLQDMENVDVDVKYNLNMQNLSTLNKNIQGGFTLNGVAQGNRDNMKVNWQSDIANSSTDFNLTMQDFKPMTIKSTIKNLSIKTALQMIKQPVYSTGLLSMDIHILNATQDALAGNIKSNIKNGALNSKQIEKLYEFKSSVPQINYTLEAHTILDKTKINTNANIKSNLVNINAKNALYDLKEASLKSDFNIKILKLANMFFITNQKMQGEVTLDGNIKKAEDLQINIHSNIANGSLEAKVLNDNLSAKIKGLDTNELLYMLTYPKIFKASLYGDVDYNLNSSRGVVKAKLLDGKFSENSVFDLIKKHSEIDLNKETYNGNLNAEINQENLNGDMMLKSNLSSISITDTKLNLKTQNIDSKVNITAKKYPINLTLQGDINNPNIKVDLKKLGETKITNTIKDKVSDLLKKVF